MTQPTATPFTINVPQNVLDDLQLRLGLTRWPGETEGAGFDDGLPQEFIQPLVQHWQNNYDWRAAEQKLNALAQFQLSVDGFTFHFIHERGQGKNALPIVLLHGWADSFHGMSKLVPLLTAERGGLSFDVVVPSMPGFGYSDKLWNKDFSAEQNADLIHGLMTALGYEKYMVFGGDWGSVVGEQVAMRWPDAVIGLHLSDTPFPRMFSVSKEEASEAEKKFLEAVEAWGTTESGYVTIQSTKPQNLAYGLNDSPVGLAAWLGQHFYAYSDGKLDRDELLNNVMIYWVTQTIRSSMRLYKAAADNWSTAEDSAAENAWDAPAGDEAATASDWSAGSGDNQNDWSGGWEIQRVEVPTALMIFPKDIGQPPREYAERFFNVQRFTNMPRGGHFAALEEPELVAAELREFAGTLR